MGEAEKVRISVRSLVEFILRSGDIDSRHGGMADKDAMQAGSRLHRKIQGRMGSNYKAEVPLSMEFPGEGYVLLVEGRADGIFHEAIQEPEPAEISGEPAEAGQNEISETSAEPGRDEVPGAPVEAERNEIPGAPVEAEQRKSSGVAMLRGSEPGELREEAQRPGLTECADERYYIDEIKGMYRDISLMKQPVMIHLAQAKCYACIFAGQRGLDRIGVQMTYCNLETEEIRRFRQVYSVEELYAWFLDVVGQYQKWAQQQIEWRKIRAASIKELTFPYPWREGQKDVAASVYRTILRKKKLFIQAPTGTGKTLSTVFPAVKAVGEGLADRIFYATAKTITRTVAEDAYKLLRAQGLHLKVLTLTAKDKICFLEETECNPEACPYAKGHYDRVNDAVFELITTCEVLDRPAIEAQALKWQVCPFEMGLDAALWADAVICDYNYIFDPRAKLKRFFGEGVKGEYLFLIDEAHNLVERGREMFSASLYKEDFLALKKEIKPYSAKMARALNRCNTWMLERKRESGGRASPDAAGLSGTAGESGQKAGGVRLPDAAGLSGTAGEPGQKAGGVRLPDMAGLSGAAGESKQKPEYGSGQPDGTGLSSSLPVLGRAFGDVKILPGIGTLPTYLMNLSGIMEDFLEDSGNAAVNEKVLDLYFQVLSFLDACDRLCENYIIYTELCADGRFLLRLFCVDISKNLQECLGKGRSTIFFSATLLPIAYYKSLLSTAKEDYAIYAHSTFDTRKRLVVVGTDTSSRYLRRNVREFRRMAEYVLELIRAKRGNYMVFFSSYKMMEDVAEQFRLLCEEQSEAVALSCQETGMREEQREAFLAQFEEPHPDGFAGFCVMGGIFGEGIDLRKDRLIGAVVVGTGLPQVCSEREILKYFYDRRGEDGFFYAYLCPGMNKVLQSAGRVIRTEEDKGVILLLDERFSEPRYRTMYPAEWEQMWLCTIRNVRQKAEEFWEHQVPDPGIIMNEALSFSEKGRRKNGY